MFISFEGIEGCGKSTQVRLLKEYLENKNKKVIVTREPGGTEIAEDIRKIFLKKYKEPISPMTEMTLMSGARLQHINNIIKPEYSKNDFILCDRFVDSMYVYQGLIHTEFWEKDLALKICQDLHELVCMDFLPDLTILLDCNVTIAMQRKLNGEDELTKFDLKNIDWHNKIRNNFLYLAHKFPDRIKIINSESDTLKIQENIITIIKDYC